MLAVFAIAMFLAAALLFAVQPMVGKMVLPTLGGSPAVWNTCMVFFQSLLLLGYAYAHLLAKFAALKTQIIIHVLFLILAAVALPIALPLALPDRIDFSSLPAGDTLSIITWLILLLALTAGAPFLVLSATAPLLQSWFARSSHAQAKDPYFLYAASNAGSIVGLVAYPALIEPLLGISSQGKYWSAAYLILVLCLIFAAVAAVRNRAPSTDQPPPATQPASQAPAASQPVTRRDRLNWIILSAVPSSLSLGVTQFISTDIAAIPLLWAAPLLLYLLSFIFAFSRRGVNITIWSWILSLAGLAAAACVFTQTRTPLLPVLGVHLLVLFSAAMVCHGRLAKSRPSTTHLTEFYLLLSCGGMLGGMINAIIAPVILPMVLEYQFAIAAALLLAPLGLKAATASKPQSSLPLFAHRIYALALLGLMLAAPFVGQYSDRETLRLERTFFGVHRVVKNIAAKDSDSFRTLYHGTTIHGVEARYLLPNIRPATYYHPTGPIGQILTEDALGSRLNSVAVIGLGAGSLALYNEPNCLMRFYEIDPAVIRIATDPALFDYLSPKYTRGKIEIVLGDGRLEIAKAPDHSCGIIILDAFSSDAIPTHLLTREAIALYRSKLRSDGLIAIHISNSFFDLKPVVAALAADAGLTARARLDIATNTELLKEAKSSSLWTVLSARDSDLGPIAADPRWTMLHPDPADPLWTDDYSNVLKALNWGK